MNRLVPVPYLRLKASFLFRAHLSKNLTGLSLDTIMDLHKFAVMSKYDAKLI